MRPTKDEDAVTDLLDVLLEEGVVLHADVVISVAEVPLVGVNLRAAVAGMATMTEHGMFEEWDREIRKRNTRRTELGPSGTPEGSTAPVPGEDARSVSPRVAPHDGRAPETAEAVESADVTDGADAADAAPTVAPGFEESDDESGGAGEEEDGEGDGEGGGTAGDEDDGADDDEREGADGDDDRASP